MTTQLPRTPHAVCPHLCKQRLSPGLGAGRAFCVNHGLVFYVVSYGVGHCVDNEECFHQPDHIIATGTEAPEARFPNAEYEAWLDSVEAAR